MLTNIFAVLFDSGVVCSFFIFFVWRHRNMSSDLSKMNGVISVENKEQNKDSKLTNLSLLMSFYHIFHMYQPSVNTASCLIGGDVFVLFTLSLDKHKGTSCGSLTPSLVTDFKKFGNNSVFSSNSVSLRFVRLRILLSFLCRLTRCSSFSLFFCSFAFFSVCAVMYAKGILTHSMQTNGYRTHCNDAMNCKRCKNCE